MFEDIQRTVSNFVDAKEKEFDRLTSKDVGELIKKGSVPAVIKEQVNNLLTISIDKVLLPETKDGQTYQVKFDIIGSFDESKNFNYSSETAANGRNLTYAAGNEPAQLSIAGEVWQNSAEINDLQKAYAKIKNKLKGFGGLIGGNVPAIISKMHSATDKIAEKAMGYIDLIDDYVNYANQAVETVIGLTGQAPGYIRKIQNIKTTLDFIGTGHLPCSFGCWGKQYTGYYLTSLSYSFTKENPYSLFVSMSLFKPNLTEDESNFTYSNKETGMSDFATNQAETDSFGTVEPGNFGDMGEMATAGMNVLFYS